MILFSSIALPIKYEPLSLPAKHSQTKLANRLKTYLFANLAYQELEFERKNLEHLLIIIVFQIITIIYIHGITAID